MKICCDSGHKRSSKRPCAYRAGALLSVFLGAVLVLAGCATPTQKTTGPSYTFFPPAPDQPRLQFLASFNSEKELRGGGNGGFVAFVTGADAGENPIGKPYGAAFEKNKILVCDTALGLVLVLDLEKKKMTSLAPQGAGALKIPLNIATDTDGTCYVADSGRDQVVILDANQNFVAALGEKGKNSPRDIVLAKDRFYVADIFTHTVHVYDKATRNLLFDFPRGADATNTAHKLFQPGNLAIDAQGRVYASDTGAFRVQVYDAEGNYVRTVGTHGDSIGEFNRNKGVAVDKEGRLYAVDAASQVVQIFDSTGHLLMWFGEPEASPKGLELPSKVVVDYDNVGLFQKYAAPGFKLDHLVLVINQVGPRKVSVYGFGKKT